MNTKDNQDPLPRPPRTKEEAEKLLNLIKGQDPLQEKQEDTCEHFLHNNHSVPCPDCFDSPYWQEKRGWEERYIQEFEGRFMRGEDEKIRAFITKAIQAERSRLKQSVEGLKQNTELLEPIGRFSQGQVRGYLDALDQVLALLEKRGDQNS